MTTVTLFEFFLLSMAAFRLTRLIVFDTITMFIRRPFHEIVDEINEDGIKETYLQMKGTGIRYWIGELLSCYWCVGVWVSALLWISLQFYPLIFLPVIIIFAIAGVSSIIETIVSKMLG